MINEIRIITVTGVGVHRRTLQPTEQHCQCCCGQSKDIKSRSDLLFQLYFAAWKQGSAASSYRPCFGAGSSLLFWPTSTERHFSTGPRWHTHTKQTHTCTSEWRQCENRSKCNSWWLLEKALCVAVLVLLIWLQLIELWQPQIHFDIEFFIKTLKTTKNILHIDQLNGISHCLSFPEQGSISVLAAPWKATQQVDWPFSGCSFTSLGNCASYYTTYGCHFVSVKRFSPSGSLWFITLSLMPLSLDPSWTCGQQ